MIKGHCYCITGGNVLSHELIGLRARVAKGSDRSRTGLEGVIVDETKNVIEMETKNGVKKLPKKEVWLELQLGSESVLVSGKELLFRPEDRVKALR